MSNTKSDLCGDVENPPLGGTVLDKLGQPISQEWAAVFAGFVWGEGCFRIAVSTNGKQFEPGFAIALREDDGHVLMEFAKKLGGSLHHEQQADKNPKTVWAIGSQSDCELLVRVLSSIEDMPQFRKRKGFEIWREAVALRATNPRKHRQIATCHPSKYASGLGLCKQCYGRKDWANELGPIRAERAQRNNAYLQGMSDCRKRLMAMVPFSEQEAFRDYSNKLRRKVQK